MLQNAANIVRPSFGGGFMGGSYHWDKHAGRHFINIKGHRIYRYNGEPIWHPKTAQKLLDKIRAEIDDGTFDIRAYLPESLHQEFKAQCAREGKPMQKKVIELIAKYTNKE